MLIWTTIAKTLRDFYDNGPRQALAEAGHDAGVLMNNLQNTKQRKVEIGASRRNFVASRASLAEITKGYRYSGYNNASCVVELKSK